MNRANIHIAINLILITFVISLIIFAITLFLNNDFKWKLIGHIYHKVLTSTDSYFDASQVSAVSSDEASKCGCPYCCSVAQ